MIEIWLAANRLRPENIEVLIMTNNPRKPNTDVNGHSFTDITVDAVWAKAKIDPEYHPEEYRRDYYGTLIRLNEFGNRDSEFGWEIDHIKPVSKGGSDYLFNLQPLHWKNNAVKGDEAEWSGPAQSTID